MYIVKSSKVTISNFFNETNMESPLQHQDGIKKKLRGKDSLQKAIVITGRIQVNFINRNCLQ